MNEYGYVGEDLDALADHPAVAWLGLSEGEKEEIDRP